jgi:hypothetical protein
VNKTSTNLSLSLFKFGKCNEQLLIDVILSEELNASLKNLPGAADVVVFLLKLGVLDPVLDLRVGDDKLLVDGARPVELLVAQLKVDVGLPGLLLGLPLHPPLKHLPGTRRVAQHLLHVRVLVPELVGARQDGDGAVPNITCVVHLPQPHLHLGVLEPHHDVAVVHVQRTLVHRPRPASVGERLMVNSKDMGETTEKKTEQKFSIAVLSDIPKESMFTVE